MKVFHYMIDTHKLFNVVSASISLLLYEIEFNSETSQKIWKQEWNDLWNEELYDWHTANDIQFPKQNPLK